MITLPRTHPSQSHKVTYEEQNPLIDMPSVQLCSELHKLCSEHYKPPWFAVFSALDKASTSMILILQQDMHKRFERSDEWFFNLDSDDIRQLAKYVNRINYRAHQAGLTAFWIKFLPWSRHAWRWGHLLDAPPPEQVPQTWILTHLILLTRHIPPLWPLCLA